MAMKILLLVMMVMALKLNRVATQSCRSRSALGLMYRLEATTRCSKPQESLVQLKVPEGYDYVRPSVAKVKQCVGLSCQTYPDKCLPDPDSITIKHYKVHAHRLGDHHAHCVNVEVEEHGACNCRCDKMDCPSNTIFNEKTCQCECNPKRKHQCDMRRSAGQSVMWSRASCFCVCDTSVECDSSQEWDDNTCRCVNKNFMDYLDYSNEI